MQEDHKRHVWQMMHDLDFCMLVTNSTRGLAARPMSAIVDVDARTLHFLFDADSRLDEMIAENPRVLLTFSTGRSRNLVVEASATVRNDRELIQKLWNAGAQAFWPEGAGDPSIRVLNVVPDAAEYWEGSSGIVGAAKFVVALASGTTPNFEYRKVKL